MMFKRFLVLLLMLSSSLVLVCNRTYAEQPVKKVLLIYDTKTEIGSANDRVFALKNLLYHFNVQVFPIHESQVTKQDLLNNEYIFVLNNSDYLNPKLYMQLKQVKTTICYIGLGLKEFSKNLNIPIVTKGVKYDFTDIVYNNGLEINDFKQSFSGLSYYYPIKNIEVQSKDVKVYAGVSNGTEFNPVIMQYSNTWIVSILDFYDDLFLIFADILNEIFEQQLVQNNNIFIRIEDVHPFRDQQKLREIANYLYLQKVPFMVSLIPAYNNKNTNKLTHIQDIDGFANTIKYMIDKGASIVMHGYTHAGYGEVTGEGFEFWDGINNTVITNVNEAEYIENRIYLGVKTCVDNEIYPLAFEPPHYAMSTSGFLQVSQYFSTYCGQVQVSDTNFTTVTFPYVLNNTDSYKTVLPENLGYINGLKSEAVSRIKDKYSSISRVRGYSAGLFYHPNIDIKYLKEIINFFKQQNVNFYDLKQHENWVSSRDIKIESINGVITVNSSLNSNNISKYFGYVNVLLVIILFITLLVLVIVLLRFRQKNKLRFLKEIEDEAKTN
ncbi:DUF2334 domain-containing protein [Clostridium sp. 'deep sea']|uniref:DUF2334 domain-containing protein n=1 Tax=Clostridium sp. 'deep sea' TaxID=2779445 RepID=UPI0018965F30|nr:DUF2334 domain-containing protein [Clostridium sp. 'deep sea']QOR35429.1 DUF2334 domain-containing protein [Clostridium sp. 'deep sea']